MAALLDLRMPGVYTQEISTLPPTVGVIPSAVPVFIGYTQKAEKKGENLFGKPTRIKSMKDYEDFFGTAPLQHIEVNIDDRESNSSRPEVKVVKPADFKYKMYHSLLFYYANGGGPCYILSVGGFDTEPNHETLKSAIGALTKAKDVTILVFPDGTGLSEINYAAVITEALQHCEKMKDRVTVIDLHDANGDDLEAIEAGFQTSMPNDIAFKKYGMAYYPYVETVFSYGYTETGVVVKNHLQTLPEGDAAAMTALQTKATALSTASSGYGDAVATAASLSAKKTILTFFKTSLEEYKTTHPAADDAALKVKLLAIAEETGMAIPADVQTELDQPDPVPITILTTALTTLQGELDTANAAVGTQQTAMDAAVTDAKKGVVSGGKRYGVPLAGVSLLAINSVNNLIYGKIKDAIFNFPVTLPPSGAIAGIYVRTDATAGVWKAPANVSVFGGIKPALEIDDDLHANLNAPASGKSINAIRTYPGRGLLVYGARTLAGNDLEWRYVNVRRTFCFIEDSIANAMQDFVFEPNNEQTWIKVRAMIKSFLNRLWKAGGLYGNTPEDAYEVICSVPESMNDDDVLNGIMRIFVKVAVARPAEFIVLQYEHKFEMVES